jgi:hypothetical protein
MLSYRIASRDSSDRSNAENWLFNMVSRMNSLGLERPETGMSGGPERTIDYASGPALPSRTAVWRVFAYDLDAGRIVQPAYWRMFTLNRYDGQTWTQNVRQDQNGQNLSLSLWRVPLEPLIWDRWPVEFRGRNRMLRPGRSLPNVPGYDVAAHSPDGEGLLSAFGPPRNRVLQRLRALTATSGYLPTLPAVQRIRLNDFERDAVSVRSDVAIDVGFISIGHRPLSTAICRTQLPQDYPASR